MRVLILSLMVLAATGCALAQSPDAFDAKVRIYNDPKVTGALTATVRYRAAENHVRFDYELLQPSGPVEIFDFTEEIRYLYCSKCEAESRPGKLFQFRYQPGDTNRGQKAIQAWQGQQAPVLMPVNHYTKPNTVESGGVLDVYVDTNNRIVRVVFADGKTMDFWGHSGGSGSAKIDPAWQCPAKDCKLQLDLFLVVDQSGSISDKEYHTQMKPFIKTFVSGLNFGLDGVQVGAVYFSNKNSHELKQVLTYQKNQFFNWFDNWPCRNYPADGTRACEYGEGWTYPDSAIKSARQWLTSGGAGNQPRGQAEKIMLVITDGEFTTRNGDQGAAIAQQEATKAKQPPNNILIFAVGIESANRNELNQLASGSGGQLNGKATVFFSQTFDQLPGIIDGLLKSVCQPLPGNPCGPTCGGFCSCNKQCICPNDCNDGNECTTDLGCLGALPNKCEWTPKNVDDGNVCTDDSCNAVTGAVENKYDGRCDAFTTACGPGACDPFDGSCAIITNSTCDDNDQCTNDVCVQVTPGGVGTCRHDAIPGCQRCVNVPPDEQCQTTTCDLTTGVHTVVTGNAVCANVTQVVNGVIRQWTPCTPGVCVPTGQCTDPSTCCTFEPTNCDTDNDPCTIDTCDDTQTTTDPASGKEIGTCVQTVNPCDDNNECTADSCTAGVGCVHTLRNDVCGPATGPCVLNTCVNECQKDPNNPSAPCTWNITCAESPVNCKGLLSAQITNDCYFAECLNVQGGGCALSQVKGAEIDDCGQCVLPGEEPQECVQPLATEAAVAIGAGVLAAIIIGAIAFVLLATAGGAGAYKVYHAMRGPMAGAASNPLYQDRGMEGDNPLYRMTGAPV